MALWKRLKALWHLSGEIEHVTRVTTHTTTQEVERQMAEFIAPRRVEEVFDSGGTIDDAIV